LWPFRRGESTGQRGERLAVRRLRREGHRILSRNYRCPAGEADVISLDRSADGGETIVFVEVKTRSGSSRVSPESAVNRDKRARLVRVARYYLAHHDTGDRPVRFDVVSVVIKDDGKPEVTHIPDAFQPY
jgi:putative endonuclease